jgi:tRNA A-37 threonylcarbamoyl transferase component Bud32
VRTFGKFRLLEPLASGGMADVWRAEVALAQGVVKEVALKLVRGEHQDQDEFVRMFVEEARLACRLSHANVVQVFEFDQVDGRHYLAMELVRGRHLGQVIDRARAQGVRIGLPRAVHLAAEAAKALAYVHRQSEAGRPLGLVHRDVSPHNLLVSFEGEVKLADFGIARAMSLAGGTEPGTLKGKLAYMAPEQAGGGPVDARADLFSLGVVLWELCAGRRLFARDTEAATLAAVLGGPPPSAPSAWNEAVPPELDAVVLGALERDPARRTGSADELAAALTALLVRLAPSPQEWDLRPLMQRLWPEGERDGPAARGESTLVRAGPGVDAAVAGAGEGETAATRTLPRPARRRAWRAAVLGGALAVIAVVGGGLARRVRPVPGPEAVTAAGARAEAGTGAAAPAASPAAPAAEAEAEAGTAADPAEAGLDPPAGPPGVLYVNATPWAQISVDGRSAGETPVTLTLPAGRHKVRAVHPSFGARETVVEIRSGRRSTWTPRLTR